MKKPRHLAKVLDGLVSGLVILLVIASLIIFNSGPLDDVSLWDLRQTVGPEWYLVILVLLSIAIFFLVGVVRETLVHGVPLHRHLERFLMSLFYTAATILVFLILIKSLFVFITASGLTASDSESSTVFQIIAILLTFVTLIVAGGAALITHRLRTVDELKIQADDLRETALLNIDILLAGLPLSIETQHVPYGSMKVLEGVKKIVDTNKTIRELMYEDKPASMAVGKIWLALGIYKYARGDEQCVKCFQRVDELSIMDEETSWLSRLRLGIAHRQFENPKFSLKVFDKLVGETSSNKEFNLYARVGHALTNYYVFKESVKFQSSAWINNPEDRRHCDEEILKLLENAYDDLAGLWSKQENQIVFVSLYLSEVAYDLWQYRHYPEYLQMFVDTADYTVRNISFNKEDSAILADYYLAAAICYGLLAEVYQEKESSALLSDKGDATSLSAKIKDYEMHMAEYFKKSDKHAVIVEERYTNYDLIYSEKQLRDIKAKDFRTELKETKFGWEG